MRFDLSSRSSRRRPKWLVPLLGFALAFQALVASVHLHPLRESGASPVSIAKPQPGVPKVHDELNCPLCLALKSGAAFVPPAVLALAPPCGAPPGPEARAARCGPPAPRSSAQPRAPPVLA